MDWKRGVDAGEASARSFMILALARSICMGWRKRGDVSFGGFEWGECVLPARLLEEEFVLLPFAAEGLKMGRQSVQMLADSPCPDGADRAAAHATDAKVVVVGSGVIGGDGSRGAEADAGAAVGALVVRHGERSCASLLVGAVARQCQGDERCPALHFAENRFGEGGHFFCVRFVGAPCAIHPANAVLGVGGNGCNDLKSHVGGYVLHFHQGVLVGSVAIDGDNHASGAVGFHFPESFHGQCGDSACIDWHGKDHKVFCFYHGGRVGCFRSAGFRCQRFLVEALTEQFAHASGSSCGAECDLLYFHFEWMAGECFLKGGEVCPDRMEANFCLPRCPFNVAYGETGPRRFAGTEWRVCHI